jgi:hypothetical protein
VAEANTNGPRDAEAPCPGRSGARMWKPCDVRRGVRVRYMRCERAPPCRRRRVMALYGFGVGEVGGKEWIARGVERDILGWR